MFSDHFKGEAFEIGKQLGKQYRKNGKEFNHPLLLNPKTRELFEKQKIVYDKYYKSLVKITEGISIGGGYTLENVQFEYMTLEFHYFVNSMAEFEKDYVSRQKQATEGEDGDSCSIFGIKDVKEGGESELVVGRTYDWHGVDMMNCYFVEEKGKFKYLSITNMLVVSPSYMDKKYWLYLPQDAINEKGLFIGLTWSCRPQFCESSGGLPQSTIIRLIAETCESVNEALEVFQKVPVCLSKNFFISDRFGEMVVVEHSSGTDFRVRKPNNRNNNILIQTNHAIHEDLLRFDNIRKYFPNHTTRKRYDEIEKKLMELKERNAENNIDLQKEISLYATDPKNVVCQNLIEVQTVWVIVLEMEKQNFFLYWDVHSENKKRKKLEI